MEPPTAQTQTSAAPAPKFRDGGVGNTIRFAIGECSLGSILVGDSDYSYSYSGTTKTALPWTPELHALKKLVEGKTGASSIPVFATCIMTVTMA